MNREHRLTGFDLSGRELSIAGLAPGECVCSRPKRAPRHPWKLNVSGAVGGTGSDESALLAGLENNTGSRCRHAVLESQYGRRLNRNQDELIDMDRPWEDATWEETTSHAAATIVRQGAEAGSPGAILCQRNLLQAKAAFRISPHRTVIAVNRRQPDLHARDTEASLINDAALEHVVLRPTNVLLADGLTIKRPCTARSFKLRGTQRGCEVRLGRRHLYRLRRDWSFLCRDRLGHRHPNAAEEDDYEGR